MALSTCSGLRYACVHQKIPPPSLSQYPNPDCNLIHPHHPHHLTQSQFVSSLVSSCSGVVAINSTLTFEVQPLEYYTHPQGGGGGDLHLLFTTNTSEGQGPRSCGVSHAAIPPIHSSSHMRRVSWNSNSHDALHPHRLHIFSVFQSKRDILSETKYIELVLVADHQEVSKCWCVCVKPEPTRGRCYRHALLIPCFLQFVSFQRNNQTIIYRLLDVANQVDWVSARREATRPSL